MKLFMPPLEIAEGEGFSPEKDIFNRKPFAEKLTSLINNTDDELVIALDAPWGEGKTTFVKMWQGMLEDKGIKNIYFDAFENDYLEDPLLALIGQVYKLIENKKEKDAFKKRAISALTVVGKASARIVLRAITTGVLDDTVLEGVGTEDEISGVADKYLSGRLDSLEKDKKSIDDFRKKLETTAKKLGKDNKIIFIVDELDRCKPSFALDFLEKIKHLFSVPKIVFVLVMNKDQMGEVIKSRYGQGVDSNKYLQKFIHLCVELPRGELTYVQPGYIYLNHCLAQMGFEITRQIDRDVQDLLQELVSHYQMSLRDIERFLSLLAIINNTNHHQPNNYQYLSVFMIVAKVLFPKCYRDLARGCIAFNDVIAKMDLERLTSQSNPNGPDTHHIKWVLRCAIGPSNEVEIYLAKRTAEKMITDQALSCDGWIQSICNTIDSFQAQ